jgi:hypothetical protein
MVAVFLASAGVGGATLDDLRTATQKIDAIQSDRLNPGARVDLSVRELNAWVRSQAPAGVRDATLHIDSPGVATGAAMVDIAKVSRSQGFDPGWLIGKLLEGEHPVKVTARIRSANGSATVDVDRVEVSGLEIDGKTLELLIQYVVLPLYPNAVVGRPFELGHNIERFDVQPAVVRVVIGPKR